MRAIELLDSLRGRGFAVYLDGGHLSVSPSSKLDDATRELLREHKARLLQLLASDMTWPDAKGDPVLAWCLAVVKGQVELPAKVCFTEGHSPVVTDPMEYVMDKLDCLRWLRSAIAVGGIGSWPPSWFTETAERLRANLAALRAAVEAESC